MDLIKIVRNDSHSQIANAITLELDDGKYILRFIGLEA